MFLAPSTNLLLKGHFKKAWARWVQCNFHVSLSSACAFLSFHGCCVLNVPDLVCLQAIVHWRPVGAHALSDPTGLDRVFVLPSVHADVIPLSVEVSLPALIRCGEPFTLRVAIVNQTDQLQSARVVWFQGVLVHHEVFLLHLMFLIFVVWVRCA